MCFTIKSTLPKSLFFLQLLITNQKINQMLVFDEREKLAYPGEKNLSWQSREPTVQTQSTYYTQCEN